MQKKKIDNKLLFLEISLAVPVANGVSFMSTSIVGTLIGEEKPKLRKFIRNRTWLFSQIISNQIFIIKTSKMDASNLK